MIRLARLHKGQAEVVPVGANHTSFKDMHQCLTLWSHAYNDFISYLSSSLTPGYDERPPDQISVEQRKGSSSSTRNHRNNVVGQYAPRKYK